MVRMPKIKCRMDNRPFSLLSFLHLNKVTRKKNKFDLRLRKKAKTFFKFLPLFLVETKIQIDRVVIRILEVHILHMHLFDVDIIRNEKTVNQGRVGLSFFIRLIQRSGRRYLLFSQCTGRKMKTCWKLIFRKWVRPCFPFFAGTEYVRTVS